MDKIHDFGIFGKWRESTLKKKVKRYEHPYCNRIKGIEIYAKIKDREIADARRKLDRLKIPVKGIFKKYVSFIELKGFMAEDEYNESQEKDFNKDFEKYLSVMNIIQIKKKKK